MDVIVLNHKNKVSLQVQHVDIGSSIDLHFPNENQSFDAFQQQFVSTGDIRNNSKRKEI